MFAKRLTVLLTAFVALAVVGLAACGGEETKTPANSTPKVIEGRFDVGDYKLYMRCEGSGSPTVVYLHRFVDQPPGGASQAGEIPSMPWDKYRICVYDRADVGGSDEVPGLRTGKSSVRDLHRFLEAAGIEPPYVLLAPSLGDLISYAYAATYPDEVVGMVLIDAAFPGEWKLQHYWPKEERLKNDDWAVYEEKIDQPTVYKYALHADKEPDIPVTFLLAAPTSEVWDGPPAWEEAVVGERAEYVESFSPGVFKKVESPYHLNMEQAAPERITREVEMLIESVSKQAAASVYYAFPHGKAAEPNAAGVNVAVPHNEVASADR
jgi:pimeloyl-ACP methyl ester carboxylesterase